MFFIGLNHILFFLLILLPNPQSLIIIYPSESNRKENTHDRLIKCMYVFVTINDILGQSEKGKAKRNEIGTFRAKCGLDRGKEKELVLHIRSEGGKG